MRFTLPVSLAGFVIASGARTADAQATGPTIRMQFQVAPLGRPSHSWPKARVDLSQMRSPGAASRVTVCPMPTMRDSTGTDSMPTMRRDSTVAQRMPVVPGDCEPAAP